MAEAIIEIPVMGCPVTGALTERVGCILSYGGSTLDIMINYSMLMINLVGCWTTIQLPRRNHQDNNITAEQQHHHQQQQQQQRKHKLFRHHLISFIFVWIFQLGLCLFLADISDDGFGCSGISIVWCAMAGWMLHQVQTTNKANIMDHYYETAMAEKTRRIDGQINNNYSSQWSSLLSIRHRRRLLLVSSNIVILLYYGISEEFITTVAHVCALILGSLLSWLTITEVAATAAKPPQRRTKTK